MSLATVDEQSLSIQHSYGAPDHFEFAIPAFDPPGFW